MLKNYLKTTWKVLLRNKLFTFINLFGISFTLLILIILTSLLDHTLGPVEPENRLDRILSVVNAEFTGKKGESRRGNELSHYFFTQYVKTLRTPETVSISSFRQYREVYEKGKKQSLALKYADAEFWDIMDFTFLDGKSFNSDDVDNVAHVAVINEATREKFFDGSSAVGKFLEIENTTFRVVGVVQNVSFLRILTFADMWIPYTHSKENFMKPTLITKVNNWHARILVREKSDIPLLKQEFKVALQKMDFPEGRFNSVKTGTDTFLEDFSRHLFRQEESDSRPLLFALFMVMILFMILPAINLININMSRIMERSTEIGVRKAFGASVAALVGQFVIENIILALIGGAMSLCLGWLVLMQINHSGLIPYVALSINYRVFIYSFLISVFFGLFSGVYPALRMSRMHPVQALRGGTL